MSDSLLHLKMEIILLLFLLLLLPVVFIFLNQWHETTTKQTRFPPGPRGLPLIGNLHQFDNLNPHLFLYNLSKKHGPLISLKLGRVPAVVISSAKIAKEVFTANDIVTSIYVNIWAIGRDPEYWENPNEFLPDRFLNNTIDYKGRDFGLISFGSGRRSCPGMYLAVAVTELALANLLYAFDWKLPDRMTEEDVNTDSFPGLVVHKKIPLCLIAKRYI